MGVGLLLGLLACVLLASGGFAIISGAGGAPDWMQLFAAMHFLTLPAAYAGIGTCMVFLVATDLSEQMKQLAITDQLTGVLNRRGFQDGALRSISQARRTGAALTAVMADLDHFKRINDTYGHGVGDLALRRFAAHLSSELRQGDLVGRVGGEEFALLLVDTDIDGGAVPTVSVTASRLRAWNSGRARAANGELRRRGARRRRR